MTDSSMKRCIKDKIDTFFQDEYNDIVESQINASGKEDFQVDEVLTKQMKVTKYTNEYNCMCLPYILMMLALQN